MFQISFTKINKILLVGILFMLAALTACNRSSAISESNKKGPIDDTQTAKSDNSSAGTNANTSDTTSSEKDKYPTVPAEIMQAKNNTSDGKSLKLADYKGKILILNLWATWCGPCRMEMPELVKISREYKDKGVEVVGLSVEEQEETDLAVKRFGEQMKIPYRLGWTNEVVQIGLMQGNGSIPQTFVINPEGKLTAVFRGFNPERTPPKLRSALDKILESK